jgi:hypothetical protein
VKVDKDFISACENFRIPDKSKGIIENCGNDVVLFAQYMLGIKLYSWQIYFLKKIEKAIRNETENREFLAITSRQIGKSTCLAIFSLWCCIFNKYPGTIANNTIVGIASASDGQAKKLLYEMKKLIRIGDKFIENEYLNADKTPKWKDLLTGLLDDKEPNNTTTITFRPWKTQDGDFLLKGSKAGSCIKSYPPTSAVLGETFSVVIIDEAGMSDRIDDQFFNDYMYPTGNSTNAIRIYTSTPWVSSGFFYRMVDPDNLYPKSGAEIVSFDVTAIELENPNQYKSCLKIINDFKADGKLDEVERGYFCKFVKGEISYFDPEKVLPIFKEDLSRLSEYSKECDMGIDFGGQVTSRTVITISAMDKSGFITRLYHKVYDVQKDLTLLDDVAYLRKKFNVQRIIPDDCPAGDFLIRKMEEAGWNVSRMNFRAEKVKKYGAFRSALNKGMIQSYPDKDLKVEMLSMEFNNGSQQSVIQHATGYTDDLIDSFVMSCYFFVTDEDTIKVFDENKFFKVQTKPENCQACNSSDIKEKRCTKCGWIQRDDNPFTEEWD